MSWRETTGCTIGNPISSKPLTVGEHLDRKIAIARAQLERACLAKAKADAQGWLNYPVEDFASVIYPDGPV